jgi:molecular chaperone DnaK (HSP70)
VAERWEEIGHVPRDARPKLEGRLHTVERAIREAEEAEWQRSNPEARARAEGMTGLLQAAVDKLEQQIAAAQARNDSSRVAKLQKELEGRRELLEQARKGLQEFGG